MALLDRIAARFGYSRQIPYINPLPKTDQSVEKSDREGIAQDPLTMAYMSIGSQWGLKRSSGITMSTLRRMSWANWVDRTCIFTLRDEITAVPWNIVPVDPKKPFNDKFQYFLQQLLRRPAKGNNWRTLIDKVVEDILVIDGGVIEKVRNGNGQVVALYHVDGATVKPCYDEHGELGEPAYQQYLFDKRGMANPKPVAEWNADDIVYLMWNPQGAVERFGYGFSPVEAGLAVATAFLQAEAYNLGFFRQNTIPPVIINMGAKVQPGEVDKFRQFLAAEMLGQDGFFKPVVGSFQEGFDIKELMKAPSEMGFKEYVEWQMKWKVALYRMSPQDIGFTLDQYKTEGQVQQQLSKNKAVDSLKQLLAEYINSEIVGDDGYEGMGQNLKFDWIDADTLDPVDQAEVDNLYINNGTKTRNEVRQGMGLDPIVGGSKPTISLGSTLVPLDNTPLGDDGEQKPQAVSKNFEPTEGVITPLATQQTAIAWMDDRGVTQPLFVTDYGKTCGFAIKPAFLDERKDQEPPEQQVAEILRALKVNTPEVKIMSGDDVLKLLPTERYTDFTNWVNVEPPYYSKEWLDRWGSTRKSPYYIVSGFLTGTDLGNEELQAQMAANPESYLGAVADLARVWLAEREYFLGDRKPGHYLITRSGTGFGVDYQFYEDENSWRKTSGFLPKTLGAIHPSLFAAFREAVLDLTGEFGVKKNATFKAFRTPKPRNWQQEDTVVELEKALATRFQKGIYHWFRKAVSVKNPGAPFVLRKTADFDPTQDYLTDGVSVWQNGVKYPLSVLPPEKRPNPDDLTIDPAGYRNAFDYGSLQAQLYIQTNFPDIRVSNPELYAPMFEKRANLISDTVNDTLKSDLNATIVRGLDQGMTYGELAQAIQTTMGVDPANADMPLWRAERIARTESMWAINEGMRAQYDQVGIDKVDVSAASTACDICLGIVDGNPYTLAEASGILPGHPNCRCVLVGDYSDLMKSYFQKGWVTINGKHILMGEGGGGGGGRGAGVRYVPGTNYKTADQLVAHEGTDPNRVSQYKKLIKQGHPVAPVVIARQASGKWGIEDGKHRFAALKASGERFIPVITKETWQNHKDAYERATAADQKAIANLK